MDELLLRTIDILEWKTYAGFNYSGGVEGAQSSTLFWFDVFLCCSLYSFHTRENLKTFGSLRNVCP